MKPSLDSFIPDKQYFTIGEVSKICNIESHVLRYWEKEFPQLKPVARSGNRRYYQRADLLLIKNIRTLLYEKGFTISGARQQLSSKNQKSQDKNNFLSQIIENLEEILGSLKDDNLKKYQEK